VSEAQKGTPTISIIVVGGVDPVVILVNANVLGLEP